MAKTSKVTPKKEAIVTEVKGWLTSAKGLVLTSYKGLDVATDTKLRSELRAAGVQYKVVKNTMLRIAAKEAGIEGLDTHLEGTTAMAFSADDAVAPAKVICDFTKKNKLEDAGILTIKVGMVEGKVIDVKGVKALANLPSREELVAKLLGSMNAPIANCVGVLSAVIRNFVGVVDAIRDKKEKEAAA
ncbi:MAG: 50S ribosomal protein L10 [Selenomonadaceae bacterium]|nr:50S ribosomal protein L10 [Selenomonadaceae bacterium]